MVLNGGGGTAVGVHVLLKVRELLLRRAAADEHEARVFVLRRDIIAAAAVIAAGLLRLGSVTEVVVSVPALTNSTSMLLS